MDESVVTITKVSPEQKKTISNLYFVECTRLLVETVEDTIRPVVSSGFGPREVTLIYLSFTNVDIAIGLPGRGVMLEGGHRRK
jgi:hypothetical protein